MEPEKRRINKHVILKNKKHRIQEWAKKGITGKVKEKKRRLKDARNKLKIIRAERLVKDYRIREINEVVRLKSIQRMNNTDNLENKVVFVLRIHDKRQVPPNCEKILQLLRLGEKFTGVFLRLRKPICQMLAIVRKFVTWGTVGLKEIRQLIYKNGFGNFNGQREPLKNNVMVEESLGDNGIVCLEDLVHEISTCGEKFRITWRRIWQPRG